MLHLQVVIASTRPTGVGPTIAGWFVTQAERHGKFAVELVDLAQVNLPMFDEPRHPRLRQYEHAHTKAWSSIVSMTKEIVTALKMMPMFETVALPFFAQQLDREKGTFSPPKVQEEAATVMLDELLKWATALKPMRD